MVLSDITSNSPRGPIVKKRVVLLAGLGIGFILGSRAGRQSYEKLKAQATQLWNDPKVQDGVKTAGETIKEKAPVVAEKVKEQAPVVAEKVKDAAETGISKAKDAAADVKRSAASNPDHDSVSDPERDPVDEGSETGMFIETDIVPEAEAQK